MVHQAKASHIGTCFNVADILAVLYAGVLHYRKDDMQWNERDRFTLSNGHGVAILYAVLAECGFFPKVWLDDYARDGSLLMAHASHHVLGVERAMLDLELRCDIDIVQSIQKSIEWFSGNDSFGSGVK